MFSTTETARKSPLNCSRAAVYLSGDMAYKFHSGSNRMGPPLPLPWLRDKPEVPGLQGGAAPAPAGPQKG